ncbi:MAG: CRISPR-associated endonuclease Cas1 [Hyphomonadaceae bacterium]|nr:CRISPR-associated endonuclease Cas1 [Hyphomonadaceae bacterium]
MNYQTAEIVPDKDKEWPIRCAYWHSKLQKHIPKRKRREKSKTGLVLTGNGLSINVDKGRLIIKDGFTHYPQKASQFEYFKGSLDIPPRIVVVDGKGSITLDALDWLAEQKVPLIRVRYNGEFNSLLTSGGQAADPKKLAWQIRARDDDHERTKFFKPLIQQKFENSIVTLEDFFEPSTFRESAITKISDYVERIKTEPITLKSLLGMEAQAASVYFQTWRTLKIKWKVTKRHPIPDEWRTFYSRGSLNSQSKGGGNIFATHPVNAMLNYVYTVLLGQTQIQVITDGYDPMLGVVHKRSRSLYGPPRPGFAIDMMEPMRPVVDRVTLKLVSEETFSGADFDLQSDGVVRVNPELARRLLVG